MSAPIVKNPEVTTETPADSSAPETQAPDDQPKQPVYVNLDHLVFLVQSGQIDQARPTLEGLLEQHPNDANIIHACGMLAVSLGDMPLAEARFRRTTELNPKQAEAWSNLGNTLLAKGQFVEAVEVYRKAISVRPSLADAHNNLARALIQLGETEEAQKSLQKALLFNPNYAEAYSNLAHLFEREGRLEAAVRNLRQALVWKPDQISVENALISLLFRLGNFLEAESLAKNALQKRPEDLATLRACAIGETFQGNLEDAVRHYRKIVELEPGAWGNYMALGTVYQMQGNYAAARETFSQAIKTEGADGAACIGALAGLALDQGRLEEAREALQQATTLNSQHVPLLSNLGSTLIKSGDTAWGIEILRQSVSLAPQIHELHSNLIFNLHYDPDATPEDRWQEIHHWGEQFGKASGGKPIDRPPMQRRQLSDPLRIGLVSADFRAHPVSRCIEPLLKHVDKSRIEFVAYSVSLREDEVTKRLREWVPHWRFCAGMGTLDLTQRIRTDGIDILIDLSVHTAGNRLKTFCERPAPIQMSWLGFFSSTGLDVIDYRLTDAWMDPPGETEQWHSETLARLPVVAPSRVPEDAPDVTPLPASMNGYVTFAGCTALARMNEPVLQAWAEILEHANNARLILFSGISPDDTASIVRLRKRLILLEVDMDRVKILPKMPYPEFMSRLGECDIALDTFPYGGGASSLDALWMGLPVITLAGRSSFERAAHTYVNEIGLPECSTVDRDGYVKNAVDWTKNLSRLGEIRASLRQRLLESPIFDGQAFSRAFEDLMLDIWDKATQGDFGKGLVAKEEDGIKPIQS